MRQHSGQAFPLQLGPGPRFPLPGELESASSRGPSPATWGSPECPISPRLQETPALPAVWVSELKASLWTPVLRGLGS